MVWEPKTAQPDNGTWTPKTAQPDEPQYTGVHGAIQKLGSVWPESVSPADIALIPAAIGGEGGLIKGAEAVGSAATRALPRLAQTMGESGVARGATKIATGAGAGAVGNAAYGGAMGAEHAPSGKRIEGAEAGAKEGAKIGAEFGAGGTAVAGAAGKVLAPALGKSVQILKDAGVKMTPGQLATKAADPIRRMEGAATSIPVAGSVIRHGIQNSIDSFNIAVLNRALKPIGEKMPANISAGREAIAHAEKAIGDKYDALVPNLKLKLDQKFIQDSRALIAQSKRLPASQQAQLESIVRESFTPRLSATGVIDGKAFKAIDSELAHDARTYAKSVAPGDREMANMVTKVRGLLRENLERSNPAHAKELQEINTAWATFKRAQNASIRRTTSQGIFTPADLGADIKKSATTGLFARGDANLQDLADAGMEVLPNAVADSGTPERQHWNRLLDIIGGTAAGGAAVFNPVMGAKIAALAAPYTKPGMAMVDKIAAPGPTRQAARALLSKNSPRIGAAAATADEAIGAETDPLAIGGNR